MVTKAMHLRTTQEIGMITMNMHGMILRLEDVAGTEASVIPNTMENKLSLSTACALPIRQDVSCLTCHKGRMIK